jgi:hypothetical protein
VTAEKLYLTGVGFVAHVGFLYLTYTRRMLLWKHVNCVPITTITQCYPQSSDETQSLPVNQMSNRCVIRLIRYYPQVG